MTRWTAAAAALALVLGVVVLGTTWRGIEVAPGVWQDSVSLRRWATLWMLLGAEGIVVAGLVSRWARRLLALVPLLCWIAWSLRGGALGPLPFVIYGTATVVAWCAGLAAGDIVYDMARSVKRGRP